MFIILIKPYLLTTVVDGTVIVYFFEKTARCSNFLNLMFSSLQIYLLKMSSLYYISSVSGQSYSTYQMIYDSYFDTYFQSLSLVCYHKLILSYFLSNFNMPWLLLHF